MKIIEWFEVQVGRFTNFLSDAKEDLVAFDEHVQNEVIKYRNKQCGKAAIVGAILGVVATVVVMSVF